MNEIDIKVEVLTWVRRTSRRGCLPVVTSEFSLNGTGIRADLAILSDDFSGIEIKSSGDTLRRLGSQMEGYARYFDKTVLIIAPKHEKWVNSIELQSASVWVLDNAGKRRLLRHGSETKVNGHTLLGLLTASEERRAMQIADQVGIPSKYDGDRFRFAFEKAFRRRYEKTSNLFWDAVKGRPIRAEDLKFLSRFHSDRVRVQEIENQHNAKWSNWINQINGNNVLV